jgi:gliding motility-associated-like protein
MGIHTTVIHNNGLRRELLPGKSLLIFCILFFSYNASGQFIPKGDAVKLSNSCYTLTEDAITRRGAIWWGEKINLQHPFEIEFALYLGEYDAEGADGVAFVFHNDPRGLNAKGTPGGGLGYGLDPFYAASYSADVLDAISPSVSIEFDTFQNADYGSDIAPDHTTVVYNGDIINPRFPAIPINPSSPNVEDMQCHIYKIKWNPETQHLQLYFNGQLRFSYQDNIIDNVFDGNSRVYYGFTGATGGFKNQHTIRLYDEGSAPVANNDEAQTEPATSVRIPVLENDSHTRGEELTLTAILGQPQSGTATIVEGKVVYTPKDGFVGTDYFTYQICDAGSEDKCYNKCTTAVVSVRVDCKNLSVPDIISSGAGAGELLQLCSNASMSLGVAEVEGVRYQWMKDGAAIGENQAFLQIYEGGAYSVTLSNFCYTTSTPPVVVVEVAPPPAPRVAEAERCGEGVLTLAASSEGAGSYRWYRSETDLYPLAEDPSGYFTTPVLKATTTYYVSFFDGTCESSRVAVRAIINALPQADAGADVQIVRGYSVQLQAGGGVTYRWSPEGGLTDPFISNPRALVDRSTTYTVTVTDEKGCSTTDEVTITVLEGVFVPNAFSPNNDGLNDDWEIINIADFPDCKVEVFDRWGSLIFSSSGYKIPWNGTFKGKKLPTGNYSYKIRLGDGAKAMTGSVAIVH